MLSLGIIALYLVPILTNVSTEGVFGVNLWSAIGAGATALTSLAFYIFAPKQPSFAPAFLIYVLFTLTSGWLVFQTGDITSPFIALWLLVSFFAGMFAIWGALPVLAILGVFVAQQYLTSNLNTIILAMVGFCSILPLIIGLLIWRNKEPTNDEEARHAKDLASKLSEVANKSEVVINAIGDGVMAVDSKGTIQLINPAAQEIIGWGKQDALMLNYKSVLQMTDHNNKELDPAHDPIQQVLNNNQEVRSNDLTIVTKSGKKIQASIVVSPIGDTVGSGVITVFRDITKEKAEEREQAEFISTASHEMRTPVASIEGYLGLALNPNTSKIDDKAREFIMKAHEAAQHLGRLFQDLLDVSKSEDGRMTNTPKVVDLSVFMQTITQGLQAKAQEKGLRLIYRPIEDNGQKKITPVYFVNLDNDHIREVFDNLIENAIKYTPKGDVTVDIEGSDDKVVVSVKDTGLGIPAEDIPHLFQKFYRVSNPDRNQIGGTGLGLYLSRKLVESMGGRLWVESVYTQGSTFFVELPRISSEDADRFKQQQALEAQQAAAEAAANPQPAQAPEMPPVVAAPTPQAQAAPTPSTMAKPATTVPRGESLTREQIAEHVRQLEAMARTQPVAPRQIPVQDAPSSNPPGAGQA